jgi:GNAT superfamily N-acetyltransferase
MPQLEIYPHAALPDALKWQILSFYRMEWPDPSSSNPYSTAIADAAQHPVAFVIVQDNLLIAHADVLWKDLTHMGQTYKTYGLGGVFTYPSFRQQGYGAQVVSAAKAYIEQQGDGDLVIFTSKQVGFYEKFGYLRLPDVTLLYGDPQRAHHETTFMSDLSPKGQQGRASFAQTPVYFGPYVW